MALCLRQLERILAHKGLRRRHNPITPRWRWCWNRHFPARTVLWALGRSRNKKSPKKRSLKTYRGKKVASKNRVKKSREEKGGWNFWMALKGPRSFLTFWMKIWYFNHIPSLTCHTQDNEISQQHCFLGDLILKIKGRDLINTWLCLSEM